MVQCISKEGIVKVSKWGNSLAIRIPAELVEKLGLKEGDELVETPGFGEEKQQLIVQRKPTREEMWAKLEEIRKKVVWPEDYKFDREEANSRGD
jgi:antitoxin MazE